MACAGLLRDGNADATIVTIAALAANARRAIEHRDLADAALEILDAHRSTAVRLAESERSRAAIEISRHVRPTKFLQCGILREPGLRPLVSLVGRAPTESADGRN